jgi:hypothetical protein
VVGILYICTGRYAIFWKKFFLSAEKNFLPGYKKKYFVFTDEKKLYAETNPSVQKIYQETLGWPYNTLFRFKTFLKAEEELKKCDYLFFFNANIIFVDKVNNEILPDASNDGLLVVKHPGFWDKTNADFLYDRNIFSTAYIPHGKGEYYFMGGCNGGQATAYLQLIKTLNKNIHTDLDKDIIALWHDESHLNNYMLDKNPKILSPAYGFVEGYDMPFKPKILVLLKEKFGGHDYLRNVSDKKLKPSKITLKKLKGVIKRLSVRLSFLKYRQ